MTTALIAGDPTRLGRYQILSRIGSGGMGTVFLGRTPGGRLVAVKVIRPEFAGEHEFRARFRSEVNRARQVPPFCTAEVLDADPEHVTPYLVVEYVDGPDLEQRVRETGPLAPGSLHSVAVGVATALAAIHGAGVVHRDLKPRNVLFALGSPKVIDFGIARAMEAESHHTRPDQMVGTLAYMAPERFDPSTDHLVGPPADVFAWGAVVAYAGTGRTPFSGDTPTVTAARILTQPPDLSGLPPSLSELVQLALAKEPADRPTAHELLDLLLKTRTGEQPDGVKPPALAPGLRRVAEKAQNSGRYDTGGSGRHRKRSRPKLLLATVAAATLLATVTGGAIGLLRSGDTASTENTSATPANVVRGPTVLDALDRPGQWSEDVDDADGGLCGFDGKMIVSARAGLQSSYCVGPGPTNVFAGDQSVAVDVTLPDAKSCGLIAMRVVSRNGYRFKLCPGRVELGIDNNGKVTPVNSAEAATLTAGRAQRVTIDVQNGTADVTVGDATVLSAPLSEPALAAGEVALGASGEGASGQVKVFFKNAELRSAFPAGDPAKGYTDLTARNVDGPALLQTMTGAEGDNAAVALEGGVVGTTGNKRTVEGSRTTVSVPVSPDLEVFSPDFENPDPDCFDPETHLATCPISVDRFLGWFSQYYPTPVQVRIRNGTVVSITALDIS